MDKPILSDQGLYMGGDKVREATTGYVFRVKRRFAIWDIDYIVLQNVDTREEWTFVYKCVIEKLSLVCHPNINPPEFIN
jgi:hypothetical protein